MTEMFLFILGHCAGNRLVLHSVYLLSIDIIRLREKQFEEVPAKIRGDPKYIPFKNYVGAIDRTHILAVIPKGDRGCFIGRIGTTTQNVMAVCDFDMMYIFVSAGWEGSTHVDMSSSKQFQIPPSIFQCHPPFDNGCRATGPRKLFNHTHSSLRSVIERIFGVTKNRRPILRNMSSYPYETHVKIVIACMALHNFIRVRVKDDEEFLATDEASSSSAQEPPTEDVVVGGVDDLRDDRTMSSIQDKIADKLLRRRQRQ
ncbi:uncharacterized protein LOC119995360 [Tripterygium wilfordii]|uniref:uncharacterized protein LOC119995360 n=1 Tax=Tripterygium wilfordii TaxID=458696 RepID=UPI0018F8320D|nr:uncharacterized protein LOC119995360 [Tripterygium wilfordii]